MRIVTIDNFPCWALCYVINGDTECLEDNEIEMIDNYIKELGADIITTRDNEWDSHFCSFPEFGLPCDCVEVSALFLKD